MPHIKSVTIKEFKGLSDISITGFERINVFVGKNNAGKSSILHGIHIACLAIENGTWNEFQPKLDIRDIITNAGNFQVSMTYDDDHITSVTSSATFDPLFDNRDNNHTLKSIFITPPTIESLSRRAAKSPHDIYSQLMRGNFFDISSIEILYTIKFYAEDGQKGLTKELYEELINELMSLFPDITEFISTMNEFNIPSLNYVEQAKKLDILYSGTGLKHLLDVVVKTTLSKAKVVFLDEPESGLHPDIQRKFFDYLDSYSLEKNVQFFISTHSQIILSFAENFRFHRVLNSKGKRSVIVVNKAALETILSDLGIRPSDLFNQDICLLVEGPVDVIFFEHIIRNFYKDEFKEIAVAVIQYGGGSASGISKGTIKVSNIVSSQKYVLWTHDRDSRPCDAPSLEAGRFKTAIEEANMRCHIWAKREIEYYFPAVIHWKAQQGDEHRIVATIKIFKGDQSQKYDVAAGAVLPVSVCVPEGRYLKRLLKDHFVSKSQIKSEIADLIENVLIPWRDEILG